MLSRVAENLYWLGRYVERAENTARIVNVNANLLLDLPQALTLGWKPIIDITGSEESYSSNYPDYHEQNAVSFLVGDFSYPNSILSCLNLARENARTIRDIVPREAWERINELFLYAQEQLQFGMSKRGRFAYLREIIQGSQSFAGILAGTMNHDAGYEFLRIGKMLERSDMTTRTVDVRSASLLPETESELLPYENIQWISVLKSLSAYQMYRQKMQVRVRRADALAFLLQNEHFPRSFYHCASSVEASVRRLPRNESVRRTLSRLKRNAKSTNMQALADDHVQLHDFIDRLQIGLGRVHSAVCDTYFLAVQTEPEPTD
jgi:uncharacterized alpha-E superfamily protein